ncbi:MAG: glucan biosynthesis protein [Thermodesulfobacteriota bacterium]
MVPRTEKSQIIVRFIRLFLWCLVPVLVLISPIGPGIATGAGDEKPVQNGFDFQEVIQKARQLAQSPHEKEKAVPQFLCDLDYDQWRDIRFKNRHSLWRQQQLPFEIQFFHPGFYYQAPVSIYEVQNGKAREIDFTSDWFHYGQNKFTDKIPEDLGYAGFRIHYPINDADYKDEVAVFLGASYFRALGKNQQYGLSARGLAIDTALDSGEEFPVFKTFWLIRPEPGATELDLYALLDSPSFTGAYAFTIRPGEKTVTSVKCRLFQRKPVKKLGIAPLTSMFFYGENTNIRPTDDFRPEIHDSDGLLMAMTTGEWIWHPLQNPDTLTLSVFQATNPEGFGLLQRDLDFDHYQDLEAHYDRRPSAWITPRNGSWGKGHIELVQIPTDKEINDNIVAFWVPEDKKGKDPKQPLDFSYDINWHYPTGSHHGGGYVDSTFRAADESKNTQTFLIDFKSGRLDDLAERSYPDEVVTVGKKMGVIEQRVQKNPHIDGWRLVFTVRAENHNTLKNVLNNHGQPINLRAFLREGKDVLTETWSYTYYP